jgi:hypothetical protein
MCLPLSTELEQNAVAAAWTFPVHVAAVVADDAAGTAFHVGIFGKVRMETVFEDSRVEFTHETQVEKRKRAIR